MRRRVELGLSKREVYELSLLLSMGVLVGGRLLVVYNERAFYQRSPRLVPAVWIGGMATHGLIIGGFTGVVIFCLLRRKPMLVMLDALAIPAALILCVGRIGNFIDGQIVGSVTSVPWAVKFPDAEGFRHPVVLYDGLKNLLIVPVLMHARRRGVPPGGLAARFLFLYAFVRIFIDYFREYPLTLLGLPAGQTMNILMSAAGIALLWRNRRRPMARVTVPVARENPRGPVVAPRALRGGRLGSMVIASDATRDIPAKYGKRHPGLELFADVPADSQPAGRAAVGPFPGTRRVAGGRLHACPGLSGILVAVSGIEVRRAIPLRRVRPVRRHHVSAGDAGQQGEGGGLREAAREGQRGLGVPRQPAEHPRGRRSQGRGRAPSSRPGVLAAASSGDSARTSSRRVSRRSSSTSPSAASCRRLPPTAPASSTTSRSRLPARPPRTSTTRSGPAGSAWPTRPGGCSMPRSRTAWRKAWASASRSPRIWRM